MENMEKNPRKRQRVSAGEGQKNAGVVIWDIDDTIVLIQGSMLYENADQEELVTIVKDYLTSYLEKEFSFSDTEHLSVVEKLIDWEEEETPQKEVLDVQKDKILIISESDIGAPLKSSTYAAHLQSLYRSFDCKPVKNEEDIAAHLETADKLIDVKDDDKLFERLPPGWKSIFEIMENRTTSYTKHAKIVLSHLKNNNIRNMIVTASEIAPAIAKLIMWGLHEYFDINDIYSSANKPKTDVFLRLLQDLGSGSSQPEFVAACGDGEDERRAATHFSIPFQKINCPADLYSVPCLLHHDFKMDIPDIRPIPDVRVIPDSNETLDRALFDKKIFEECVKKLSSYKLATFMDKTFD